MPARKPSDRNRKTSTANPLTAQAKRLTTGALTAREPLPDIVAAKYLAPPAATAVEDTLRDLAPLLAKLTLDRQRAALEQIIDALLPEAPLPAHMLTQARMTAQARSAVLESGDWLTAAQIAELAGFSKTNPSAQPNRWKSDGLIFAIRHRGMDYYPAYGLDGNHRPLAGLERVLKLFGERKDGWRLAYWFASVNSHLGGKRPQDLLAKWPGRVIAAAQEEIAEISHG